MRDFVGSEWFKRPTVAVEYDELFERNPTIAFDLPFDVGLTYACWTKNQLGDAGKINGGVIYLNNRNPDAVRTYYAAYLKKFLDIKEDIDTRFSARCRMAEWGGDEITHIRMLPSEAFPKNDQLRRTFVISGAKVMLLESVRFNCQHAEKNSTGTDFPRHPATLIRHFHGWRKLHMAEYAERHLGLKMIPTSKTSWGWMVTSA